VKTYKNLYEQVYDYDNLYHAYLEARKSKRFRDEVLEYSANLEENLINLQNHLIYQSYRVGNYKRVIIRIPKKRIIMVLPFNDRVLQWAIYRVVNPLFTRSYISDSYGCIVNRGDLKCVRRIQYWLKLLEHEKKPAYILSMDIRKYFFRIPHDIMLKTLRKKIADERLMWLFETIVKSKTTAFGLSTDVDDVEMTEMLWDVGMPVGSLNSQMIANIVLNELDQYVKHIMKVPYYLRYMDNFIIISDDKAELHRQKEIIQRFLHNELRLDFSYAEVSRARDGIEFAGYRVWADKLHIRKSTALRMKRNTRHVMKLYSENKITLESAVATFRSYMGMISHCDNQSLMKKMLDDFVLVRNSQPE